MARSFPHERLSCYQRALTVSRWFRSVDFPSGDADLKSQGKRAASSIVLNIAEGSRMQGRNRRKHFAYAEASAAEACAVLDVIDLEGGAAMQAELREVAAMVAALR